MVDLSQILSIAVDDIHSDEVIIEKGAFWSTDVLEDVLSDEMLNLVDVRISFQTDGEDTFVLYHQG